MSHVAQFEARAKRNGSAIIFHREDGGSVCPCVRGGARDPEWHVANPLEPKCNQVGHYNPDERFLRTAVAALPSRDGTAVWSFVTDGVTYELQQGSSNLQLEAIDEDRGPNHRVTGLHAANNDPMDVDVFHITVANGRWPNVNLYPVIVTKTIKGFVQPAQVLRGNSRETTIQLFGGQVERDDHIGIIPYRYSGSVIDFQNWSAAGEDWIEYNGRRYLVVAANLVPDPASGIPHHWELALRLTGTQRAYA